MPTLTLNATTPIANRLAAAIGRHDRLGGNATIAQVEAHLRAYCRALIHTDERNQNTAVFVPTPADLT